MAHKELLKGGSYFPMRKLLSQTTLSALPLLLLSSFSVDAQASQQVPYTAEEYAAFQEAVGKEDLTAREDAIIGFMKERSESALVEYALGSYLQLLQDYHTKGQTQKIYTAGEKLLTVKPSDLNALNMTAVAAYQLKKYDQFIRRGESVYRQKPSPGFAYMLANAHNELKHEDQFIKYADLACPKLGDQYCYQLYPQLTRIFVTKKQWQRASGYAQKALDAFANVTRPANVPAQKWDEDVKRESAIAYSVLGRRAAERQRWSSSVSNYRKALRSYPRIRALNAEARYYIGLGEWKQGKINNAMKSFVKGSALRGTPHADPCRKYAETLYKSTHNGSLAGFDAFVERNSR